jgi:ATP-dependent helicase/nuclease subunit B
MLRVVTGRFHPDLETALVEHLQSTKADDPFIPVALVVPSASLADYLKRLLAVESQIPLFNVHLLTLHQFVLRLQDDLARSGRSVPPIQLVDDFYFEQLLRQVIRRAFPGVERLARLPSSPGTWKGLWATVRDIKDAVVDPATTLKAVAEGLFEEDDSPWLQALFTLHAGMIEASRSLAVGSPDDLAASLSRDLFQSGFLGGLRSLFFYGFYDLLQVQLSFIESVVRCAPVTLYVPLEPGPAYSFSRRFFERHLLPLAETHEDRSADPAISSSFGQVELSVTSVIGSEEELATVCREILDLVEIHNYRFDDIGVVARSFDPYRARLQSVFDRHLIPFISTAERSLLREPLAKALLRLASLPVNGFEQSALLDVIASPFYRIRSVNHPAAEPRPDIWRIAVLALGITKGAAEWARLKASVTQSILDETVADEAEEREGKLWVFDPVQAALLSELATALIHDCEQLPQRGSISRLTKAFCELVTTHFVLPGWMEPESAVSDEQAASVPIELLIKSALNRLLELDALDGDLSWEEWTELFRLALEETGVPIEDTAHRGVQVLDVMEGRGIHFRALFVLGLNEQIFPRVVREDPFLRDRQRLVLESTLGFLIEEKLAGHEEERLLFEILSGAASNRLYLSYQRADEAGRIMAPSPFVAAAQRDPRFVAGPERSIPLPLSERVAAQPAIQDVLPARDLAVSLVLHGQDVGFLLDHMGQDRSLFDRGLSVQVLLERDSPDLGPFDGIVGTGSGPLPSFDRHRLSPTSLERYATCPFQYFAEKQLRLEPVRAKREDHLPAPILGTLLHATLRLSYERLRASRWPDMELNQSTVRTTILHSTAEVFAAHAAVSGTGHALLWTLAQEQVVELVILAVASDQEDYRTTGYRPQAFEIDAEGLVSLGEGSSGISIRGRLDRIDVRSNPPGLRIVDYKFKQGGDMKTEDRNLVLGAARGFRLQAPLYAFMRLSSLPPPDQVQFMYLAPHWERPVVRSTFDRVRLTGKTGDAITQTILTLVQGIERQEFFMLPDGYCNQCSFRAACRRHDTSAWWRSYRSPQARLLRRLRKVKVSDE